MILRSGNHLRGVKNFLAGNRRNSTSTLSSTTVNTLITSKETRTSCSAANVLEKQQMDNGFLAYRNASKTVLEVDNQETNINNSAGFKKRNARCVMCTFGYASSRILMLDDNFGILDYFFLES